MDPKCPEDETSSQQTSSSGLTIIARSLGQPHGSRFLIAGLFFRPPVKRKTETDREHGNEDVIKMRYQSARPNNPKLMVSAGIKQQIAAIIDPQTPALNSSPTDDAFLAMSLLLVGSRNSALRVARQTRESLRQHSKATA